VVYSCHLDSDGVEVRVRGEKRYNWETIFIWLDDSERIEPGK
jgi:hypothetical protein